MIAFAGAAFAQTVSQASGDKASCCCGCCGDSCDMKKKDSMKNHVMAADKDGCCGCCGDSCDMKNGAKTTGTTMNMSSEKHDGCCGDSCDMKDMKEMKPKP
jgi:hypothetical protein